MRARSLKRQREMRERRALVAELLEQRPWCERCRTARSVDLHEVKSRGRGGSILSVPNIVVLCRRDHRHITEHPDWARRHGWLLSAYATEYDATLARIAREATCGEECPRDHVLEAGRAAS